MFTGVQFTHFIQANPALAVFLTVALGFLLGKLRIRSFSLGTVTSVLLVGYCFLWQIEVWYVQWRRD